MFCSSQTRRVFLAIVALVFILIAGHAAIAPEMLARGVGYALSAPNGYSEVYAIYVGLWLATAALALLAAVRIQEALLGDIVAILVLAQPVGRTLAALQWGLPEGSLLAIFALEVAGGLVVLAVRPSASDHQT